MFTPKILPTTSTVTPPGPVVTYNCKSGMMLTTPYLGRSCWRSWLVYFRVHQCHSIFSNTQWSNCVSCLDACQCRGLPNNSTNIGGECHVPVPWVINQWSSDGDMNAAQKVKWWRRICREGSRPTFTTLGVKPSGIRRKVLILYRHWHQQWFVITCVCIYFIRRKKGYPIWTGMGVVGLISVMKNYTYHYIWSNKHTTFGTIELHCPLGSDNVPEPFP